MKIRLKTKLNMLHMVKLCFFSMLLYSSFLMEAMDVRIAHMTLLLGMLTAIFMVLDMQYSPYGFIVITTDEVKILLAFIVFSAMGTVIAYHPRTAWSGLIQLIQNVMLMMITIYICVRDGSISFCARTIVIVMFLGAMYALINAQSVDNRLALTASSNSNVFGHNAVLGFCLSTIAFGDKKQFRKGLFLGLCAVFGLAVVLSASRMSFIALLVYIAGYLVYYFPKKDQSSVYSSRAKLLMALAIAIGFVIIISPYFEDTLIAERMLELFNVFDTGEGDGEARIYLYKTAWEEFLRHPIFGLGYANFAPRHFNVYTHSTYAEVLSCTGIVGAVIFSMYYLHIIKGLRYGIKLTDPVLQRTNRLLLLLFIVLLLLGIGEILIYKIKYFIVFGMFAAQFWLNKRNMVRLTSRE